MPEMVLNITPNGNVKSLYKDELRPVLDELGEITIPRRASDVVFEGGLWFVDEILDNKATHRLPKGFKHRKDAIAYEVEYLQNKYL